jgi:PBSX family phage terminase large subunit
MAQVGLDDCQRAPGLKVLFLRKVLKSAAESFDDLVRRVFAHIPHDMRDGRVVFENESRILIGGFNNERDIDKYLGIEYDVIVIEESTQLTGEKRDKIRGSLRTSRLDWRTRMYESTNPDGIGHSAFKELYIQPFRSRTENKTRFFPSTYRDNPLLPKEYIEYLQSLKGSLGSAWRDGDWDVFSGMSFPQFDPDLHVIQPFQIPAHWPKWRAIDWGTGAPFCCLWLAKDLDRNRVFVYREIYQNRLTDREQARLVKELTPPDERITITYADPSMWSTKNLQGVWGSTADEYAAEGIILTKANNDRIGGKRNVDRILATLPDGRPGVQFFDNCTHIAEQLASLVSAKKNPEDVDTTLEDHAYDAFKYGLTNQPREKKDVAKQPSALFKSRSL